MPDATNDKRWWTAKRTLAAQLVAEGELTEPEICREVGWKSRASLVNLKHDDRFKARIVGLIDQLRAELAARGARERINRVDAQQRRIDLLEQVREERAAADEFQDIPGGKTGLLVHKVKVAGKVTVDEYSIDGTLLTQTLEHEKRIAEELNQWRDTRTFGRDGREVKVTREGDKVTVLIRDGFDLGI